MPNQTIIEEYLVKLGFAPTDSVGFGRFQASLRDVSSLVNNTYTDMAKKILGFQVAGTSAFAAIGAAALGIADKVANADQEYRLLALHMYTSLPVARELKVALDALGQPLENVMWDKELAGRFNQLVKDQQKLTQELGPDFENNMVKIRDLKFEFTELGAVVENYLIPMIVNDLAKAFGTDVDGLIERMKKLNDYIISNMPQIAEWFAQKLKPVLVEVYDVLLATWKLVAQLGAQLKDVNWVGVVQDIGKAIIAMTQLEGNIVLLFSAANAARKGNFAEALGDLRSMKEVTGKSENSVSSIPAPILSGAGPGLATPDRIKEAIAQQARALGVPVALALAVAAQESSYQQFDNKGNVLQGPAIKGSSERALGIMQLLPSTARDLGVDPNDTGGNILGGVKKLSEVLKRYGNQATALSHYGGRAGAESQEYAREVLAREGRIEINIQVETGASAADIGKAAAKAVDDASAMRRQRTLAEFNNLGYSY